MAVTIDGSNTPTAGGVGYGDGTELAFTSAGSAGQVLTSAGSGAPSWQDSAIVSGAPITVNTSQLVTTGTLYATPQKIIALDSDRDLIIFGGANNTVDYYGIIYDSVTDTFGSAVLIRAGSLGNRIQALLISTGTVLFTSTPNSTAFEAVVLTTSGTTLTVNTAATSTLAVSPTALTGLIAVGSTYVLSYYGTGANKVLGMTVSGTTVTIGSETTVAAVATSPILRSINSSTCLVSYMTATSSAAAAAVVVSVSGTTLTVGTPQNNGGTQGNSILYCKKLASGRFALVSGANTTPFICSIVTVSGTSVSFSTVNVTDAASSAASVFGIDVGNQVLMYDGAEAVFVLTDTSGTISASTLTTVFSSATNFTVAPFNNSIYGTATNTGNSPLLKVDISGSGIAVTNGSIGDVYGPLGRTATRDALSVTSYFIGNTSKTIKLVDAVTSGNGTARMCVTTSGTYYFFGNDYGYDYKAAYIPAEGGIVALESVWAVTTVTPSSTHYFTKVTLS